MQTNSVVTVAPPRPPNENVRHHIGDRRHVDTLDAGELYMKYRFAGTGLVMCALDHGALVS